MNKAQKLRIVFRVEYGIFKAKGSLKIRVNDLKIGCQY